MTGNLLWTLSPTAQADNALVKNAADKGGYTLVQAGAAGDKLIDLAAARQGGSAGRRFIGGAETTNAFVDVPAQTNPIFAFRKLWSFGAAPTVTAALDRWFPTSAHATANSLTWSMGTDRKMILLEAGTTSLSVAAVALPAASHLCTMGLVYGATGDANAGKVILRTYLRGDRTLLVEQQATMAAPLTIASWRMGIGTTNSLAQQDVADMTGLGSGDWLSRPDLADLVFDPPLDPGGARIYTGTQKITVVSGYTGPKSYRVTKGGAPWLPSQPGADFVVPVGAVIDDSQTVGVVECAS